MVGTPTVTGHIGSHRSSFLIYPFLSFLSFLCGCFLAHRQLFFFVISMMKIYDFFRRDVQHVLFTLDGGYQFRDGK